MRLVDLHCDWLWQYATELVGFTTGVYDDLADRLGQLDGYLSDTILAVLPCARRARDWDAQQDPWDSVFWLIARYQAEFSGRILMGPADVARWDQEPADGLCWGLIGVEGFDALIREPADLSRLADLFERGVRVFQVAETVSNALAGVACSEGDASDENRGLTELGLRFLEQLESLALRAGSGGPRPLVDLAHLSNRAVADLLAWYEAEPTRADRLPLLVSHGLLDPMGLGGDRSPALSAPNLARLRALGGTVGVGLIHGAGTGTSPGTSNDDAKAGLEALAKIPFRGRPGYEGIAVGSVFLEAGNERRPPAFATAGRIVEWLAAHFDRETANAVIASNASRLARLAAGEQDSAPPAAETPSVVRN
jgi:membrane dipeptidase